MFWSAHLTARGDFNQYNRAIQMISASTQPSSVVMPVFSQVLTTPYRSVSGDDALWGPQQIHSRLHLVPQPMQQLQALLQNGEFWRRPHWSPFIPALEEQEWDVPSSAETISCSPGTFRALQQILIRSQAEGVQLGSYTGCKAMPAVVQAKEELKLIQRKKKIKPTLHTGS